MREGWISPEDYQFLVTRLQVPVDRIDECRELYMRYRKAWELCGQYGPLKHDYLVHIACISGVIELPEAAPARIVKRVTREDVEPKRNGKSDRPAGEPKSVEETKRNDLLNYQSEVGVVPARLIKHAKNGKSQIRTHIADEDKTMWVPTRKLSLPGPLAPPREPHSVGRGGSFELKTGIK